MTVTSIIAGPHVKDSAHFAGRAIDVGLPKTKQGYDYIVQAIDSGKFSRIGTTKVVVDRLAAYAKQKGVDMFVDEGTGPHVHLEVAP